MLPRHYLYQWGTGALNKDKWGPHRGADYFITVLFIVLCVVSKRMCKCASLLAEIHFKSLW